MVFLEFTYKSKALKVNVAVNVLLPERANTEKLAGAPEGTFKTLYLFHGMGANHADWVRKTNIELYAAEHGIAVVMPEVGRTWYTDTAYGQNYFTFVTEELPAVCRSYFKGMTDRREDNLVAGFSMGGYGALKAALRCPDKYSGCAILSSALDITRDGRSYLLEEFQSIFGFDIPSAAVLKGTEHDVFSLVEKNSAAGLPFPKLYMWCGTEDSWIGPNRDMHRLLDRLQVEHLFEETPGSHTWKYWDLYIRNGLDYLLRE